MMVNSLQALSLFVIALANGFSMGMVAVWLAIALSATYPPLFLTWLNQHVDSRVRATVISMRSQTDALGQIAGGPMLGLVGQFVSLRLAMFGAGLTLVPALALYLRANRLGKGQADPESVETWKLPPGGAPSAKRGLSTTGISTDRLRFGPTRDCGCFSLSASTSIRPSR
jgi:hypothetical protein